MTDLAALQAKVAARRARELAKWQAAYDALPAPTPNACAWCGDYADGMGRDDERLGPCCARCRRGPVGGTAEDLVSIRRAAEIAKVTASYLRQEVSAGRLDVVRRGRQTLVSPRALDRWRVVQRGGTVEGDSEPACLDDFEGLDVEGLRLA